MTYEKTRVRLVAGIEENNTGKPGKEYINACYVNSPVLSKKIIASQGPLPQTVDHFWQMIIENNVNMIVSTCNTKEAGRPKCEQFWPKDVGKPFFFVVS
jgi:protein tyrosine phosphatase